MSGTEPALAGGYLSSLAVIATLLPLAGGIIIGMLGEQRYALRTALSLAFVGIPAAIVLVLAGPVAAGQSVSATTFRISPLLSLHLRVDRLGLLFGLTAAVLWFATTIYSRGYLGRGPNQRRYFAFLVFSLSATLGVAWAGNLFTLYVCYELLTLATYPLVVHEGGPGAARSGRTYIAYSLIGASLVLLGITGTLMLGGSLDFVPGGLLAGVQPSPAVYIVAFCFIAGFGVKAALVPLHGWLPQAMVAPTPVSALLHAVAVVKSGVFGILRALFFVIGARLLAATRIDLALSVLAGASILLASLSALRQNVLKRRLAYSTISQLAYITFGAATLGTSGMMGGLLHLLMHAVMKITLFFCAGIIITQTGRTRIDQLDGIGRIMPWTMGAFTVASLGMIGIAPVCGFVSKWYLMTGGLESRGPVMVAVLFASSLLNAAYFLPIVTRAFFRPFDPHLAVDDAHGHGQAGGQAHAPVQLPGSTYVVAGRRLRRPEAPAAMLGPVLVLAAASIALGLWPAWPLELVRKLVGAL